MLVFICDILFLDKCSWIYSYFKISPLFLWNVRVYLDISVRWKLGYFLILCYWCGQERALGFPAAPPCGVSMHFLILNSLTFSRTYKQYIFLFLIYLLFPLAVSVGSAFLILIIKFRGEVCGLGWTGPHIHVRFVDILITVSAKSVATICTKSLHLTCF